MKKWKLIILSFLLFCFLGCQEILLDNSIQDVDEGELSYNMSYFTMEIYSIVATNSSLNDGQRLLLMQSLEILQTRYPDLGNVISYLLKNGGPIMFKMNSALACDAGYDSSSRAIEFKYADFIEPERILEEILHTVQHSLYGYQTMLDSRKNVEYEVRVFRDILEYKACTMEGMECNRYRGISGDEDRTYQGAYKGWISMFISTNLSVISLSEFNSFAQQWKGYTNTNFNISFYPSLINTFWIYRTGE